MPKTWPPGGSDRPVLVPIHGLNTRSESRSHPFSDSFVGLFSEVRRIQLLGASLTNPVTGCARYGEYHTAGTYQNPQEGANHGLADAKTYAKAGRHANGHQSDSPYPGCPPCLKRGLGGFRTRRALRPPEGNKEADQQGRFEQITHVLQRIAGRQIAGFDNIDGVDDGCSQPEDTHCYNRRLAEAIASTHGDDTQDAERQVRETDLKLKRVAFRLADGLCYSIGEKEVAEEATDPATCDTDAEEV